MLNIVLVAKSQGRCDQHSTASVRLERGRTKLFQWSVQDGVQKVAQRTLEQETVKQIVVRLTSDGPSQSAGQVRIEAGGGFVGPAPF